MFDVINLAPEPRDRSQEGPCPSGTSKFILCCRCTHLSLFPKRFERKHFPLFRRLLDPRLENVGSEEIRWFWDIASASASCISSGGSFPLLVLARVAVIRTSGLVREEEHKNCCFYSLFSEKAVKSAAFRARDGRGARGDLTLPAASGRQQQGLHFCRNDGHTVRLLDR